MIGSLFFEVEGVLVGTARAAACGASSARSPRKDSRRAEISRRRLRRRRPARAMRCGARSVTTRSRATRRATHADRACAPIGTSPRSCTPASRSHPGARELRRRHAICSCRLAIVTGLERATVRFAALAGGARWRIRGDRCGGGRRRRPSPHPTAIARRSSACAAAGHSIVAHGASRSKPGVVGARAARAAGLARARSLRRSARRRASRMRMRCSSRSIGRDARDARRDAPDRGGRMTAGSDRLGRVSRGRRRRRPFRDAALRQHRRRSTPRCESGAMLVDRSVRGRMRFDGPKARRDCSPDSSRTTCSRSRPARAVRGCAQPEGTDHRRRAHLRARAIICSSTCRPARAPAGRRSCASTSIRAWCRTSM